MKYKGKIEISKDEMDCLFGWLEKLIRLDRELGVQTASVIKRIKTKVAEDQNSEEVSEEDEEEESIEWDDGDSEENIQEVHEPLQMDKYQSSNDAFSKGKKVATDLFETWSLNFDTEGEQPPRGQIIEDLAKNIKGRELYKYMKHQYDQGSGTTLIMRELLDDSISDETIRYMAENFTQVTSILFHQLSDFLRYPNPLDQEE